MGIALNSGDGRLRTADELEAEAKRLRKEEKQARKRAKARKAQRKLAVEALERVAANDDEGFYDGRSVVAAAMELLHDDHPRNGTR